MKRVLKQLLSLAKEMQDNLGKGTRADLDRAISQAQKLLTKKRRGA